MNPKAIVLFSGGLDSTTCLYKAMELGFEPLVLSFDYRQRHKVELIAGREITQSLKVEHITISVDLRKIGGSALTDDIQVPHTHLNPEKLQAIPVTYVPVRNMIFLSLAYALAESKNADAVFIGANAIDYSGYPDCRPDFFDTFKKAVALGSKAGREGRSAELMTPLLSMSKADILQEAMRLNVPIHKTWSCYDPQVREKHYFPCRNCDACLLREKGFSESGHHFNDEVFFGSPVKIPLDFVSEAPTH